MNVTELLFVLISNLWMTTLNTIFGNQIKIEKLRLDRIKTFMFCFFGVIILIFIVLLLLLIMSILFYLKL